MLREAMLYRKLEDRTVECGLCSHRCRISEEKFGICKVRQNRNGTLYTHVYGKLIAENIDPIEKKPLYHFFPGSRSYSIATMGCNFQCSFCQNWHISQVKEAKDLGARSGYVKPESVVADAISSGSKSISYTYTEPTIFFEYAYDTSQLAKQKGLYNVFVTNGFMTEEAIRLVRPYLDAANIDLKAWSDDYYRKLCKGRVEPVLKSIELMKNLGIWVEVTTLVVPGENDSDEEFAGIAGFLSRLDRSIPWHISRFYPQYRMDHLSPTPLSTLNRAYRIGKEAGLWYVYLGNVGEGNNTYCHVCNRLLIERRGFSVTRFDLRDGRCPDCNTLLEGVGF